MKDTRFERTELLFGEKSTSIFQKAHVAVFGLGGVGSFLTEALARMGIGRLSLFDGDVYTESNLNRQLYALPQSIGQLKTEVAKERIAALNEKIEVFTHPVFLTKENVYDIDFSAFDYIADAIDTVSVKIELAVIAQRLGIPIISAMGAGNKTDPTAFRVADIYETKVCPLARLMRTELRKRGVASCRVVYSEEPPRAPLCQEPAREKANGQKPKTPKKAPLGSCSFVPSAAGLIMAAEVSKGLLQKGV